MTTDRPYRRARPVQVALDELRACSGTQFDPTVVSAVIAVVERRAGTGPALDEITLAPSQALDRPSVLS
jgi:HD-GYP domain-containing protein (c-di-GMP phosphodiesterase class II)